MAIFSRILWIAIALTSVIFAIQSTTAQDEPTRTYNAPSLAAFDYPLDTYSVRQGQYPCMVEGEVSPITFPGVISIEPNDSFIYAENQGTVYKITIASQLNDEGVVTEENLEDTFGTLALLQYEPVTIRQLRVESFELDGLPAVRVDDIPVGQNGVAAHIIVASRFQLFEIIIEPVMVNNSNAEASAENLEIIQGIIDSIHFDIDDEARWS
jgi:hypothetical protein